MTLSLFGFVTCLQNHISLSDECDTLLSTSECFWLRLNRQSFYHYRKRQLVPTDRYRFRSIGKLIGSVSHDRVAYRYLDAFPKCQFHTTHVGGVGWEPQGSSTTSCVGKADHGFGVCVPLALICLLKIVNYKLFYYIKNLKSRLYAAKFFKILKFVFLSEVADKSFCVKFSGLISKHKILEKTY